MAPLILTHYTVVSALGKGLTETYQALRNRRSGLRLCDFEDVGITTSLAESMMWKTCSSVVVRPQRNWSGSTAGIIGSRSSDSNRMDLSNPP